MNELGQLLDSVNLVIDRLANHNMLSISGPRLEEFLREMNELVLKDDRIHLQQQEFANHCASLRQAIEQGAEGWRIANMHTIEQIFLRADEITKLFEREVERALLNEPAETEEHESGMCDEKESWAKMCTNESEFIPDEQQLSLRIPFENLRADQINDLTLPMDQEQCNEQEQGNDQVQNFEPIDSDENLVDENLVNENSVPKKSNEQRKEVILPTNAEHNTMIRTYKSN